MPKTIHVDNVSFEYFLFSLITNYKRILKLCTHIDSLIIISGAGWGKGGGWGAHVQDSW